MKKLSKRHRKYLNRETRKLLPSPMSELSPDAKIYVAYGYWEPSDGGRGEYIFHEDVRK